MRIGQNLSVAVANYLTQQATDDALSSDDVITVIYEYHSFHREAARLARTFNKTHFLFQQRDAMNPELTHSCVPFIFVPAGIVSYVK